MKLSEISVEQFSSTDRIPMLMWAINSYLVKDELMNLMEFSNSGFTDNLGNIKASYKVWSSNPMDTIGFRKIGEEYTPNNVISSEKTVILKALGGKFESDRILNRAFGGSTTAIDKWVADQLGQKLNGIKNAFGKYYMLGNSATNDKEFDGLQKYFTDFPKQVVTKEIDLSGGLDATSSIKVERQLLEVANMVKPQANVILTTDSGKALLQTINAFRNKYTNVIEIGNVKYNQYAGYNIVALPDYCWASADITGGKIPVVFMRIAMEDGFRCVLPQDGEVLDILLPKFDNGTGNLVQCGACEMITAPLFANAFGAAKVFIKETAEAAG